MPIPEIKNKQEVYDLTVQPSQQSIIYTWSLTKDKKLKVSQDQKGFLNFRLETANAVSKKVFLDTPLPSHSKLLTEQQIIELCNNSYPKLVQLSDGSHKLYLHTRGMGGMMQEDIDCADLINDFSRQSILCLDLLNTLAKKLPRSPEHLKSLIINELKIISLKHAVDKTPQLFENAITSIVNICKQVGQMADTWKDQTCRTLTSSCALFADYASKLDETVISLEELKTSEDCEEALSILSMLIADVQQCQEQSDCNQKSIKEIQDIITKESKKLDELGLYFESKFNALQAEHAQLNTANVQEQRDLVFKSVVNFSNALISTLAQKDEVLQTEREGLNTAPTVEGNSSVSIDVLTNLIVDVSESYNKQKEGVKEKELEYEKQIIQAGSAIFIKISKEMAILERALKSLNKTLESHITYWKSMQADLQQQQEKNVMATELDGKKIDPRVAISQILKKINSYRDLFNNTLLSNVKICRQTILS